MCTGSLEAGVDQSSISLRMGPVHCALWQDLQEHAEKFRKNWRPTERWSHSIAALAKICRPNEILLYMSAHVRHVDSGAAYAPSKPSEAGGRSEVMALQRRRTCPGISGPAHRRDLPKRPAASFFQHRTDPKTGIKYLNQAVQKEKDDNMRNTPVMTLRPDNTGNGNHRIVDSCRRSEGNNARRQQRRQ